MLIDFDPPRGGDRERICRPRQPGSDITGLGTSGPLRV